MEKISAVRRFVAILIGFLWLLPSVGNADPHKLTCGKEKTIGEALRELKPGDTLLVSGTCNENVEIPQEVHRITLDGQGTATINGSGDLTRRTISITGTGITIKGFTITGGLGGILVTRGGEASIESNIIQNANAIGDSGGHGVFVNQHSSAQILNNTIQNNARDGIQVGNHSYARIGFIQIPDARISQPNTIQNNGANGINVSRSSSVQIGYSTIKNNTGRGISVGDGSSAQIGGVSNTEPSSNNIIQGNGSDGIRLTGSSMAQIVGNTISNNKGHGVLVNLSSSASIFNDIGATASTTTPNTIQQNGLVTARRDGIQVTSSSSAFISGNTIDSNTGHGVRIIRASHASIGGNAINNSGLDGIRVEENSGVNLDQANTGSNSQFGLRCLIGAYARGSIGALTGGSGATNFDGTCINVTTP